MTRTAGARRRGRGEQIYRLDLPGSSSTAAAIILQPRGQTACSGLCPKITITAVSVDIRFFV